MENLVSPEAVTMDVIFAAEQLDDLMDIDLPALHNAAYLGDLDLVKQLALPHQSMIEMRMEIQRYIILKKWEIRKFQNF